MLYSTSETSVIEYSKLSERRRDLLATATFTVALLTFVIFLWYALPVLLLLFLAALFAIPLSAACSFFEKRTPLPREITLLVVLAMLALLLYGGSVLFARELTSQFSQLLQQVPQALVKVQQQMLESPVGREMLQYLEGLEGFRVDGRGIVSRATGFVSTTSNAFFMMTVIAFAAIYFAADPELYSTGMLRLIPINKRERFAELFGAVSYTLRRWMVGQFLIMSFVGICTTIGLILLGVPLALGLGFLAFLLDFVPTFGPIIAALPAIALTFAEDPTKSLYVIGLYLVIQQTESMLVTPLLHRRTVYLPPVMTITAQVLLATLAGPLGLLLATPLSAVVLVLMKLVYVEEALGDEIETPLEHLEESDKPKLPGADHEE